MQNFMKIIINAIKNWTKDLIAESKADWNQNDPNADSYIKNRTHWENDDGSVHTIDRKYLPDNLATMDDIQIVTDVVDSKMNKENPSGTGSLTMNGALSYGDYSFITGLGATGYHYLSNIIGKYNITDKIFEITESSASVQNGNTTVYYSTASEKPELDEYGYFVLKSPVKSTIYKIKEMSNIYWTTGSSRSPNLYYSIDGTYTAKSSGYVLNAIRFYCSGFDSSKTGKYAHIVGNGTSDSERSNAHTLDWSGNAWYQGDVYTGGTGQDDEAAKKLATEEFVDEKISSYIGDATIQDEVYVQSEEPVDAPIGSIWVDTDADGVGGLTTGTVPTATTSDNDKILQIVEGEYKLLEVKDSSIATYIDNYINEALGGEF